MRAGVESGRGERGGVHVKHEQEEQATGNTRQEETIDSMHISVLRATGAGGAAAVVVNGEAKDYSACLVG